MNKKLILLFTLIIALLISFGVYSFYKTHEYKEVDFHTGFKGEARKNPLYAARLFLKRMGIPTINKDSVQGMGDFPDTDTVILLNSNRSNLTETRTEAILDWVKSGGHLLAHATNDWSYFGKSSKDEGDDYYDDDDDETDENEDDDSDDANNNEKDNEEEEDTKEYEEEINTIMEKRRSRDPLQRMLGIRTGKRVSFLGDYEDRIEQNEEDITDIFISKIKKEEEHTISLKNATKKLTLRANWFYPLILEKDRFANSEQIKINSNNYIIRQRIGKGMVTLVADFEFIQNRTIEQSDHAEILWQLIHGLHTEQSQPANIWLINNDEMSSLWTLMWRYGWAFLSSLVLLFLFWLLSSTRRFGPLIPKLNEDRRSLNEHISSSGNYYWKNNKKQMLVDSARQALMKKMARIHPGWAQLKEDEQIKVLSEQADIKPELIHKLLHDNTIEQGEEFTVLIRQLENIRKNS